MISSQCQHFVSSIQIPVDESIEKSPQEYQFQGRYFHHLIFISLSFRLIVCLNESDRPTYKSVLTSGSQYLESDCDEQVMDGCIMDIRNRQICIWMNG